MKQDKMKWYMGFITKQINREVRKCLDKIIWSLMGKQEFITPFSQILYIFSNFPK